MKYPLQLLPDTYALYYFDSEKFKWDQEIENSLFFILKEDKRITVVAKEACILNSYQVECSDVEKGYRAFRIKGPIPFAEFGVLNFYLTLLANAKISVLVHSTFHNDMIFVKQDCFQKAISILGHYIF